MSQGSKNNFEQSQTLEKGPLHGSSRSKKSSRHCREAQSCLKTSVQQEEKKKSPELEKEEGKEQTVASVARSQTKCCPWKESKRLSRLRLWCVLLGKEAEQHLRESPIPRTRNIKPIEPGDYTVLMMQLSIPGMREPMERYPFSCGSTQGKSKGNRRTRARGKPLWQSNSHPMHNGTLKKSQAK